MRRDNNIDIYHIFMSSLVFCLINFLPAKNLLSQYFIQQNVDLRVNNDQKIIATNNIIGIPSDYNFDSLRNGILAILEAERDMEAIAPMHEYDGSRGWKLFTNGTLKSIEPINLPASKKYGFIIVAKGDYFQGWPKCNLKLNENIISTNIEIDKLDYKEFYVTSNIEAGFYNVEVEFTNDLWEPNVGDRNFYLDKLIIIESTTITNGYSSKRFLQPGDSVVIASNVYSPDSILSVKAEIKDGMGATQGIIDLYDSGLNSDLFANDNVYSNSWQTLANPLSYIIDIVAVDKNGKSDTLRNSTLFSTDVDYLPQKITHNGNYNFNPSITQTPNGILWLTWSSDRSGVSRIWYKTSSDNGKTWSTPKQITDGDASDHGPFIVNISGKLLWLIWCRRDNLDNFNIWYKSTHDYGSTWSSEHQLTTGNHFGPRVHQTNNGRIWLVYNEYNGPTSFVMYKYSDNFGISWSSSKILSQNTIGNSFGSIISDSKGDIYAFWRGEINNSGDIFYKKSIDNGENWSEEIQITNHPAYDSRLSATIDSEDKIYLAYNSWRSGYYQIWYQSSLDGLHWTEPKQYTKFLGSDLSPCVGIISGLPHLVWHSNRFGNYEIWSGNLENSEDLNPPPHLLWSNHKPYSPAPQSSDIISVSAEVIDESNIGTVEFVYTLNNQSKSNLAMFDDGSHNDSLAGDNIWGIEIGPYSSGSIIEYQVEFTDIDGNSVISPNVPSKIEIMEPYIAEANILLVADYKRDYSNSILPYYADALDKNNYTYDVWDSFLRGEIDSTNLNKYKDGIVIWFTPDQNGYITNNTTQTYLMSYLDSGGKLFITGQDIGSTLKESDFYNQYLHAQFVQNVENYVLSGVDNDPISDGLTLFIIGEGGANNQWAPDEILPLPPAESIFYYGVNSNVSEYGRVSLFPKSNSLLSYENDNIRVDENQYWKRNIKDTHLSLSTTTSSSGCGGLRVKTGTYKVVNFGFGFEGINSADDRAFVMYSIMKWLSPSIHEAGISFVSPDKGNNLGSVSVTIHGYGFNQEAIVKLSKSGYQDIIGTETIVVESGKIRTTFDLAGVPLGLWDVVVLNFHDSEIILAEGFKIEIGRIDVKANLIGRESIRLGREQTYHIIYENIGNLYADEYQSLVEFTEGVEYDLNISPPDSREIDWSQIPIGIEENGIIQVPLLLPTILPNSTNGLEFNLQVSTNSGTIQRSQLLTRQIPDIVSCFIKLKKIKLDAKLAAYKEVYSMILKKRTKAGVTDSEINLWVENNFLQIYTDHLTEISKKQIVQSIYHSMIDLLITVISEASPLVESVYEVGQLATDGLLIWAKMKEIEAWEQSFEAVGVNIRVVNSWDPNEKSGNFGVDSTKHFITNANNLKYLIYFENLDSATAAAQEIVIIDTLDKNLDWDTFSFDDIQFGSTVVDIPDSSKVFHTTIHLNDTTDVKIDATFNLVEGILKWHLQGVDMVYGGWGDILPPNVNSPEGEGHVSFTIKSKQELVSGMSIRNRASIIFDVNPPIITNEVFNTIDASPPSSAIQSISISQDPLQYELSWSGSDEENGSGLKDYTIYYSDNGSPYNTWLINTSNIKDVFYPEVDRVYRFYSVARDSVGNTEMQPDSFDVKIAADLPLGLDDERPLPKTFSISQNYPNPFNFSTTILFELPIYSNVKLEIYNILGQKIKTLLNDKKEAGYHRLVWDGQSDNGFRVTSGIYLLRLIANEYVEVKKAILLK